MAFSRAKELVDMAVTGTEDCPLTMERLMKIGTSDAYKRRREYIKKKLEELQDKTMPVFKDMIAEYDVNTESPSFEGGYDSPLRWYKDKVAGFASSN